MFLIFRNRQFASATMFLRLCTEETMMAKLLGAAAALPKLSMRKRFSS